jgi:hypothetical protein
MFCSKNCDVEKLRRRFLRSGSDFQPPDCVPDIRIRIRLKRSESFQLEISKSCFNKIVDLILLTLIPVHVFVQDVKRFLVISGIC